MSNICTSCGTVVNHKVDPRCKNVYCSDECLFKARRKTNEYKKIGDYSIIYLRSSQGLQECLIDTEDIEKVKKYCWYAHFSKSTNSYYADTTYKKNRKNITLRMHRIIANCPENLEVDHRNHNTLDNRKENLRVCTHSENSQNLKGAAKNNRFSKVRGVSFHKSTRKWQVDIGINYKKVYIGLFNSIEEAEKASIEARQRLMPYS